jgi:hypothetical protein
MEPKTAIFAIMSMAPRLVGVNAVGAMYHYNVLLPSASSGSRPYLIQQIWKNVGGGVCASQ